MATLTQRGSAWVLNWHDETGRYRKTIGKVGTLSKRELDAILKAKEYELASRNKVLTMDDGSAGQVVFVSEALAAYLAYLQPRVAYATFAMARNRLNAEFLRDRNRLLNNVNEAWFTAWWQKHASCKPSTRVTYMAVLMRFLLWCKTQGYRTYDRLNTVAKPPAAGRPLPKFYTLVQVQALYTSSPAYWAAVWKFALNTGLRSKELADLTWDRIKPDGVHVYASKTKDWRVVPLSAGAQEALDVLRQHSADNKVVDTPGNNALSCMCKYYSQKANLPYGIHALRHTFASTLVMQGVPMRVVQHLLGHASITTTEIYAHLHRPAVTQAVALLDL